MSEKAQSQAQEVVASVDLTQYKLLAEIQKQMEQKQMEYIREMVAPSLDIKQVPLLIYRANKLGLNLLAGEISAYTNKEGQMVLVQAREGKRRKAGETNELEYMQTEAVYAVKDAEGKYKKCEFWEGGELLGATCRIKRKGHDRETVVTVKLSEYNTGYKIWANKPETMIKKVAQSQALSEAFPELGGVYDESEIPTMVIDARGGDYSKRRVKANIKKAAEAEKVKFDGDVKSVQEKLDAKE